MDLIDIQVIFILLFFNKKKTQGQNTYFLALKIKKHKTIKKICVLLWRNSPLTSLQPKYVP